MNFTINRETPAQKFGYGIIPMELRGRIVYSDNPPPSAYRNRIGGEVTNEQYAKEHSISRRQASKKRRGY